MTPTPIKALKDYYLYVGMFKKIPIITIVFPNPFVNINVIIVKTMRIMTRI